MVRHVILWTLRSDLTDTEKKAVKATAKEQLERLYGVVPTLKSITVHVSPLATSNCDMMLETVFDHAAGLAEYAEHPVHRAVAKEYIAPYVAQRVCMDFEV